MRKWIDLFETYSMMAWAANATPDQLEQEARGWENAAYVGGPAANYVWHFDPAYPVSRLLHVGYDEMMKEDMEAWAEDGQPDRYTDIFTEPLREPIILSDDGKQGHVWDGCHRAGAYILMGRETIPAIVGIYSQDKAAMAALSTIKT